MAPKSVSFKAVWDKIMSNKEQSEDSSNSTHTPTPLVTKTSTIPGLSPSTSNHKKLLTDRPLRIPQNFSVPSSYPESDLNGFSVDSIENLMKLQYSDKVTQRIKSTTKDSDGGSMSIGYNLISNHKGEMTDKETPKTIPMFKSDDSLKSSKIGKVYTDDLLSGFEFNVDSIIPTPKLNSKVTTDFSFRKIARNRKKPLTDFGEIVKDIFSDKPTIGKLKSGPDPFKSDSESPDKAEKMEVDSPKESPKNLFSYEPVTMDKEEDVKCEDLFKDDKGQDDQIKILVFTDTHLGYKEEDIYRGDDSMNTFEEVLYVAKHMEVDVILHSGDLFDKNIPSRTTMYRTMDLLSKYLLKDEVTVDVDLSGIVGTRLIKEQKVLPSILFQHLTCSDSVCVTTKKKKTPFFVIHGNHDNPTDQNCLSPIDILDVAGLVTYFGRMLDLANVVVRPIMITKNNIKIALYGLGWIKDERMVGLLKSKKIKFQKCEDFKNCYKILIMHQNRYPRGGHGVKDYVTTDLLPEWFDLIIWGHEHESIKFPQKNPFENFQILQTGSTIQTCLVPAEIPPKHACMIYINSEQVKFYPLSLMTARRFIYDEIHEHNFIDADGEQPEDIHGFFKKTIENIMDSNDGGFTTHLNCLSISESLHLPDTTKMRELIDRASSPLLKIKVDSTLCENVNPKLLGNSFIGKVANPYDILKITTKKDENESSDFHLGYTSKDLRQQMQSPVVDECQLKLLLESELNEAVTRFAKGMESQIIAEYVRKKVAMIQDYLKVEMKKAVSGQLSEDLYSELIEKFIMDKTSAEKSAFVPKDYNLDLNDLVKADKSAMETETKEYRKEEPLSVEDASRMRKKRKGTKSDKCVN